MLANLKRILWFLPVLLTLLIPEPARAEALVSLPLVPYKDPWRKALPRLLDIGNRQYNAWIDQKAEKIVSRFRYRRGQVTLSYHQSTSLPYFSGTIKARGLKPFFCYQMKLVGKPVHGRRGWGAYGDDETNERLGYAGRWWDDDYPPDTNISDAYYQNVYLNKPDATKRSVYGYLYIGAFVTDKNGNYEGVIAGNHSYHVTWQEWQLQPFERNNSSRYRKAGTWLLPNISGYGYGQAPFPVTLYYEYEAGRPQPVVLPPGTYNCRFMLTEESFHGSGAQGSADTIGGSWETVLVSEDFRYDAASNPKPDPNLANDVRFTIRSNSPIQPMLWPPLSRQ